jgi:hypothetical protein
MLSFNISYPNLIKLPSFINIIQGKNRVWKETQRHSESRMTLRKTLIGHQLDNLAPPPPPPPNPSITIINLMHVIPRWKSSSWMDNYTTSMYSLPITIHRVKINLALILACSINNCNHYLSFWILDSKKVKTK